MKITPKKILGFLLIILVMVLQEIRLSFLVTLLCFYSNGLHPSM